MLKVEDTEFAEMVRAQRKPETVITLMDGRKIKTQRHNMTFGPDGYLTIHNHVAHTKSYFPLFNVYEVKEYE